MSLMKIHLTWRAVDYEIDDDSDDSRLSRRYSIFLSHCARFYRPRVYWHWLDVEWRQKIGDTVSRGREWFEEKWISGGARQRKYRETKRTRRSVKRYERNPMKVRSGEQSYQKTQGFGTSDRRSWIILTQIWKLKFYRRSLILNLRSGNIFVRSSGYSDLRSKRSFPKLNATRKKKR